MNITVEMVIEMCKDTPVAQPTVKGYALVPVEPGGRIHVKTEYMDIYIVITNNVRKLFCGNLYVGAAVVIIEKGPGADSKPRFYLVCIRGDAVIVNGGAGNFLAPVGNNGEVLFDTDRPESTRHQFAQHYYWLKESDPTEFAKHYQEFLNDPPHFCYNKNKFLF